MIDSVVKTIVKNAIFELNTFMECEVTVTDPLTIQPKPQKPYKSGFVSYPPIQTQKRIPATLEVGDWVIAVFDKYDLTNAVILGKITDSVIEEPPEEEA